MSAIGSRNYARFRLCRDFFMGVLSSRMGFEAGNTALFPFCIRDRDVGDYETDNKSGKKTLTVKFGVDRIGHLSILIALLSLIILYYAILAMTMI